MFLLAVRSLAVYLAAAAFALFLLDRFVTVLSSRARIFLAAVPLIVTGPALFTGEVRGPIDISYQTDPLRSIRSTVGIGEPASPILGDVAYQMIPWRKAVRESVFNGRFPLWNHFMLGGEPLLATMQPAALHPFTWIGMLLPLGQAWTLEMALGLFLALVSAYAFFRDLSLSDVASAFGALGWAFSDYLRFYAGWPLSPAAAPLPLLLLGLRRLASGRDRSGIAITVLSLALIVVAGHPESLLHAVAGGSVWFLYCLAFEARGGRNRALLLSLLTGAIALGLTAVVLLPHVEALHQTFEYFSRSHWWAYEKKSRPLLEALATFQQAAIPYSFGVSGHGDMAPGSQVSQAYVGSLLVPFAAMGAASRRRVKWIFLLLALLGFGAWAHLPGITDGISALPLFDLAINERLVFLGCFALAALGALGVDSLAEGRDWSFLVLALLALLALVGGFLSIRNRLLALGMPAPFLHHQLLGQLAPLAIAVCLVVSRPGAGRTWKPLALLLLFLTQRMAETAHIYPTDPRRAFYPPLALLDPIPRGQPYRMAGLGMAFLPNVSTMYGLEDARGYSPMTLMRLYETYELWCTPQPVWFNRAKPFLSFLNVRYFLAAPDTPTPSGWRTLSESPGGRVVENPHALPRVFVPFEILLEPEHSRRIGALKAIDDFGRRGVVTRWPGHALGAWTRNGSGSVSIVAYGAQSLSLDVESPESVLVATSVPGWKGWRVTIDGIESELLDYNHAFLAFEVPPGRHRATLVYFPRTVAIGGTISLATLLAGAIAAISLRRSSRRQALL
jgi:hypothetical protein